MAHATSENLLEIKPEMDPEESKAISHYSYKKSTRDMTVTLLRGSSAFSPIRGVSNGLCEYSGRCEHCGFVASTSSDQICLASSEHFRNKQQLVSSKHFVDFPLAKIFYFFSFTRLFLLECT